MDSTIDGIISESNNYYKIINDIPNELKFSSNRNISGKKSKPIPVTLADVSRGNNIQAVHAAVLSFLWGTGAYHCMIIQQYVKKFRKDFRHHEITYETASGDYKANYNIKIDFILPEFSEAKISNH